MSRFVASVAVMLGVAAVAVACSASSPEDVVTDDDAGAVIVPDGGSVTPESGTGDLDGGTDVCGDGKVQTGEECDDGNTKSDDGCSATCKLESAFEGDTCPGKALTLVPGSGGLLHATVNGTTTGAFNHYGSACGGGSGADVVYTFTPASSGKAVVSLHAAFPAIVSVRSSCDVSASEVKCADVPDPDGGATTMDFPVFAGLPVSIFIDGYAGSNGTFTLDVDVSNAICGNGVAELPEACDDGNLTGGDGCSATCTLDALGALDVCPGQPFVLSGPPGAARKISFSGNTNTQGDTTESAPGSFFGGGKNVIYAVKSDVTGSAKVDLLASYAKSELYARSDCASNTYQLGAADADRPGTSSIELPVSAGQWFYLFVDGKGGGTAKAFGGPFSLDVAVTPAACGNHRLDGDEQCDDGNAEAGDGCSATCTREPLAGLDTCPGHAVTLAPQADGSRTAVVSGTTAGLANDVSGCQSLLSASAPDAIFAVTPDIDGLLQLDVSGPFNSTVSVLDSCAPPAGARTSVLACSYAVWFPAAFGDSDPYVLDGSGSGPKSTGAPVIAGRTYYVVVDGAVSSGGASSGPFELRMRLTAPTCGNGVIEGAETCDDGALDDNDGCSATCQLEPTGPRNTCASADDVPFAETTPGTWNAAVKSGTTNLTAVQNFGSSEISAGVCWARGRDAFFKVTAPASGVLRATAKSDAFDVILGLRQPVCATTTAPTACSNDGPKGVDEIVTTTVAAGDVLYLVVDTPLLDVNGCTAPISSSFAADCAKLEETGLFTLDVSISPSGCGDGFFVASATEQCDDGNLVSGDGCSATCTIEPTAGVDTCPGAPLALTGAGTQPRRGSITIDTSTLNGDYSGACGGSSKEGVVRVTAPMNGTLTAKVRNMLGATVYARAICIDPSSELLKTSGATCPNVVQDVVSFPVTAGADYFLFVDGLDGAVGVPTLDVTVAP